MKHQKEQRNLTFYPTRDVTQMKRVDRHITSLTKMRWIDVTSILKSYHDKVNG
jgi:hypothetical protein